MHELRCKFGSRRNEGCRYLSLGVKQIGAYAFSGCQSLTTISLPDSISELPHSVFDGCKSLRTISLPKNLSEIADGLFRFSGLNAIVLPASITKIGSYAFEGTNIRSVVIPESVMMIGVRAFRDCKSLEEVSILGVPSMEMDEDLSLSLAFDGCDNIATFNAPENLIIDNKDEHDALRKYFMDSFLMEKYAQNVEVQM